MSHSSSRRRRPYLPATPEEQVEKCNQRIERLQKELAEIALKEQSMLAASKLSSATTTGKGGKDDKRHGGSPTRVVRDEGEIQSIVERLIRPLESTTVANKEPEPFRPGSGKVLSAEEVGELVDRLGVNDLATRNAKMSDLLQQAEDSLPLKRIIAAKGEAALVKLDMDTQQELGARLCDKAVEHKRAAVVEQREKFLGSMMKSPEKLSKSAVSSCAVRLCDTSLRSKEEELAKLVEKYMPPLYPAKKLTLEEQKACGDRLCVKK